LNIGVAPSDAHSLAVGIVLLLLHLYLGCMTFTHGFRKAFRGGRIAGTARWFDSIGMKSGLLNAYAAAVVEMGAGTLLILGFLTPVASSALVVLMLVAIVSVYRRNGFMIANPGGGIEYCLTIAIAGQALGTFGADQFSLHREWRLLGSRSSMGAFLGKAAAYFASKPPNAKDSR
jgi:putative oxidoreductase